MNEEIVDRLEISLKPLGITVRERDLLEVIADMADVILKLQVDLDNLQKEVGGK